VALKDNTRKFLVDTEPPCEPNVWKALNLSSTSFATINSTDAALSERGEVAYKGKTDEILVDTQPSCELSDSKILGPPATFFAETSRDVAATDDRGVVAYTSAAEISPGLAPTDKHCATSDVGILGKCPIDPKVALKSNAVMATSFSAKTSMVADECGKAADISNIVICPVGAPATCKQRVGKFLQRVGKFLYSPKNSAGSATTSSCSEATDIVNSSSCVVDPLATFKLSEEKVLDTSRTSLSAEHVINSASIDNQEEVADIDNTSECPLDPQGACKINAGRVLDPSITSFAAKRLIGDAAMDKRGEVTDIDNTDECPLDPHGAFKMNAGKALDLSDNSVAAKKATGGILMNKRNEGVNISNISVAVETDHADATTDNATTGLGGVGEVQNPSGISSAKKLMMETAMVNKNSEVENNGNSSVVIVDRAKKLSGGGLGNKEGQSVGFVDTVDTAAPSKKEKVGDLAGGGLGGSSSGKKDFIVMDDSSSEAVSDLQDAADVASISEGMPPGLDEPISKKK